jgi:integrase
MTRKPLTDAAVRSFKARPARYEVPDHGAQFLYLVVQPSGAKSWALRYSIGGKPQKFTLGPTFVLDAKEAEPDRKPEVNQALTLAAARALDAQYAISIRRGIAPAKDRPTREGPGRLYPEALRDYWAEKLQAPKKNGKPYKRPEIPLGVLGYEIDAKGEFVAKPDGLVQRWGDVAISAIRREDVVTLLDDTLRKPIPGESLKPHAPTSFARKARLQNALAPFLKWAGRKDIVESLADAPKGISRDRVLSDAEVRLVWNAAGKLRPSAGRFVRLLLATGVRRDEAAKARFAEIEGDLWSIPGKRTKTQVAHLVPLSSLAREIIGEPEGDDPFVFRGVTAQGIGSFSKTKASLDKFVAEANGGKPIDPWRLHDIRRTVATNLQKLGVPREVTEAVLGHSAESNGGRSAIVAVYQRHNYAPEKKAALDQWAIKLRSILGENVESFAARRTKKQSA